MLDRYQSTLGNVVRRWPVLGLALTHHRTTRGKPLRFRDMPYLIEMYTDVPDMDNWVVRKGVQTGVSEWAVQFVLERTGWQGRIAAYVLPTYAIRDRFVQQRINPILQSVPAYRERVPGAYGAKKGEKGVGNLKSKQFGAGMLLFLGSNTPGDFIEFSTDSLVIDEYDNCDPANLAKAKDRLRASPYPQMLRMGNPTLPNVGISRLYDESDRRQWFHKCGRCGERQPLDWFVNVVDRADSGEWVPKAGEGNGPLQPVCRRCHRAFSRDGVGGLWVAEDRAAPTRGYTISRLDVLSQDLDSLLKEWKEAQGDPARLAAFYTSILGIPFEFSGARLDVGMLQAAATGAPIDYGGGEDYAKQVVTAGIDVGAVLNVTISVIEPVLDDDGQPIRGETPKRRAVLIAAFRTFGEVIDALTRYRVDLAVFDADPETHKVSEVRDHFIRNGGTRVFLCRFHPTPRVGALPYGMNLDYRAHKVTVDRTAVFDQTFEDIRSGMRVFPEDVFTVLGWAGQMKAPVRVLNEAKGRIIWHEGSAPDHYRLADVYERVAFDILQMGGTYSAG